MLSDNHYPILEFDDTREAILEPAKYQPPVPGMPSHGVLCFFNDVVQDLAARGVVHEIHALHSEMGRHPIYIAERPEGRAALLHPGVGASLSAALLEEYIACGCGKIIACGAAGVLDSAVDRGHVLVPAAAIRDEGTSYHYLPPSRRVDASPEAVTAIEATLVEHNIPYDKTITWTTDGVYRETPGKIQQRRMEGCLTVEMEAAALFAVAQFRGVALGQLLYGGDDVSGSQWDSRNWKDHAGVRQHLLELAFEACLRL